MQSELGELKAKILELIKRDEEFRYAIAGLIGIGEILERLDRNEKELVKLWEEIKKLREDMNKGFASIEMRLNALGARWGLMAEESFRESLKAIIEREFERKVERWVKLDSEGLVFGRPATIEINLAVSDEKVILIGIKSHVDEENVRLFKRKAEFYEKIEGRKPSGLIIATPYAEEKALEAAKELQIEVYTKV